MAFMKDILTHNIPIWEECAATPFVQEVQTGKLPLEKFKRYMIQDSIYLKNYARIYGKAIFHADTLREIQLYYSMLNFVNDTESEVRLDYLKQFCITDDDIELIAPLPENQNYIDFMFEIASHGKNEEILMAVLPCMLSYSYIFRKLAAVPTSRQSRYWDFIKDYADEQYTESCKEWSAFAFKYLISECYSRDMSMKTKSAKYAKMRRGEYQSVICPYGYRKSADGRMEPDEDVAPNVQMIFQWASEGNTAAEITRKLYAMNIPTPGEYRKLKGKDYYNVSRTNGVWSTSTVLRILEDQRYIGTYVIGKRKVKEIGSRHTQLKDESEWFKIPNHHPAIVSVDLFEKANASIKRFSLSNKKPRDYLLRGKVFCGCCDHAMSLRNGAWFYCRHSEVAETLPCHGVRIKMADLEQVVFETIRAQMCPALGIDSNKDKLDLQTVQQAEHEEKLRSIQDSKRHLYEQYALGEIDLETYRTRKAVYDTELVQAKNVHAVITAQTKQIKSDYEIKLKQQEIVQEVGNANMLTKALIDRLINKVYVFPGDRIEIEYATQDFLETKQSEKEV